MNPIKNIELSRFFKMRRRTSYIVHCILLFSFFFFHISFSSAQNIQVSANIDSNTIHIGEQVKIHLIAAYPKHSTVTIKWPSVADTLTSKVQVVSKSTIDTVKSDSLHPSLQEQKQDILITSFDSGYYAIPPFSFIVNGDTAHPQLTEPIMLYVKTVAVDTTKGIKDIKAPYSAPWTILEIIPWLGLGAAIIIVLLIIIYYIRKRLKNKKPVQVIIKAPPIEPHIKALKALEALAAQKLWQEGKIKDYHSHLTDILRQYLEERFGVYAQEMITDEIMRAIKRVDIDAELKNKLKQVLVLADLVKFAKEQPLPKENEDSFNTAVEFVKNTVKPKENNKPKDQSSPSATTQPQPTSPQP